MDVGNYTLLHLLGRGGTSEVYAAQHRFLGDLVAVKILRAALAAEETHRVAFTEEAARTRGIQHPNIVRVIDFGYDAASASCYLVMDFINGETLTQRLSRVGRLDETTLRALGAAIADGMAAAHACGIVHRDLKPGNVMLRGDDPVIVDFGIAKSLGATTAAVTERRVGTVAYMAPEQLVDGLITPAVDIWALGVTLYEAAAGERPFKSFEDGRLPQLFESPPRLSNISPAFDRLIARCLDRDPGKRPASMAEVAAALRARDDDRITVDAGPVLSSRAAEIAASVAGIPARLRTEDDRVTADAGFVARTRPRSRRWFAIGGALAIAVSAVGVIAFRSGSTSSTTRPPEVVAEPPPVSRETPPPAPAPPPSPAPTIPVAPTPAPVTSAKSAPSKRTPKPHPAKPRKTSQGETLD